MSLNWREIDLVLKELSLGDSFIQEIVQPDFRNLYFHVFRTGDPFFLRVCLETGRTRIHKSEHKPRKPRTRQRFAQLLHSRLRGGRIESAKQINRDRIIRVDVSRGEESLILWIRLWGGASNVIFTDAQGLIIDAFFRRPGRDEISDERFMPRLVQLTPEQIAKTERFEPRWTKEVNSEVASHYRALEHQEQRERRLSRAQKLMEHRLSAAEKRRLELDEKLSALQDPGRMRHLADLLYAYLHTLAPGQSWAELEDYECDNAPVTIQLDPGKSPQQNAEAFYERARKSERRGSALREEVQNLDGRIRRYAEQLDRLEGMSNAELDELIARERPADRRHGQESTRPGLSFESHGFTILVGRNSRENDALLRHHTRGNDTWLHTRDYPGGYVFVRSQKGKSVPLDVLLDAGMLAIHFSKAKTNGRADLYYTQVKYLRRAKNGPPGLVLPTNEKNLHVQIDETRIGELLE